MRHACYVLKFAAVMLAALFLAGLSFAQAQEAAGEEKVQQIQLTVDIVKRYIAAFEDIKKWQKANDTTASTDDDEEGGEGDPLSAVKGVENSEQMKTMLKKHGFNDIDVWTQTAQSVTLAYIYADPQSELVSAEDNIKKTIEQTKANKDLSEEEKKETIANLENDYKSVADMKPLQSNIDVVKPFVPEIKKMLESE